MAEELSSRDLRMPEKKSGEAIVQMAPAPEEKKVSLHVSDAPVAEVLRGLAEMTGENVIFSSHVKERVTASLDDVTPEEAMTSIMAACGLAGRKEGSTLIIFSSVTEKESGIFAKSYRLSYANAKEAAESLTDMVSKGKVSYNQSANTVLVSGTPAELMQVDALLRGMDIPEKQVKVEAEVIAVNKSSAKELGLDWISKASPAVRTMTVTAGRSSTMYWGKMEISSTTVMEIPRSETLKKAAGTSRSLMATPGSPMDVRRAGIPTPSSFRQISMHWSLKARQKYWQSRTSSR